MQITVVMVKCSPAAVSRPRFLNSSLRAFTSASWALIGVGERIGEGFVRKVVESIEGSLGHRFAPVAWVRAGREVRCFPSARN